MHLSELKKQIRKDLYEFMRTKGWSFAEAGKLVGVSKQRLFQILVEKNKDPKSETLDMVAEKFGFKYKISYQKENK